jgi:hypothetical protein
MNRFLILIILLAGYVAFAEDVLRPNGEISSAYNDYYSWSPPVNIGIEAGITYNYFKFNQFSNLPDKAPEVYSQGVGYAPYILGIIDYRLNNFFGIQLGVGYQQVKYANTSNTFDYTYSGINNFDTVYFNSNWSKSIGYLHTRLAFRYNLSYKFNVNLGGFFNYKLNESNFENKLSKDLNIDTLLYLRKMDEAYSSDATEKMLFGVTAGAEYRYYFTNELYLNFHGQYQFSFINAMSDVKVFPRFEKIYQYFEFTGRQNQLLSAGLSLIYKY